MEYTLKFTQQEMQVLNAALVELPFKVVAPLVGSINEQLGAARAAMAQTDEHIEDTEQSAPRKRLQ